MSDFPDSMESQAANPSVDLKTQIETDVSQDKISPGQLAGFEALAHGLAHRFEEINAAQEEISHAIADAVRDDVQGLLEDQATTASHDADIVEWRAEHGGEGHEVVDAQHESIDAGAYHLPSGEHDLPIET